MSQKTETLYDNRSRGGVTPGAPARPTKSFFLLSVLSPSPRWGGGGDDGGGAKAVQAVARGGAYGSRLGFRVLGQIRRQRFRGGRVGGDGGPEAVALPRLRAGPEGAELVTRKRSSGGRACAWRKRPSVEELTIEDEDRRGEREVEDAWVVRVVPQKTDNDDNTHIHQCRATTTVNEAMKHHASDPMAGH
jgi:hypothetical protein